MKVFLFVIAICFSFTVNSQSIFKRLPKPSGIHTALAEGAASDLYAFRAIVNVGSYAIPDNSLLNGMGVCYGHFVYNPNTDKMEAQWSINALAWDKASLNGDPNTFAYGLSMGVWNNRILFGGATSNLKKFFATIGIGININNN